MACVAAGKRGRCVKQCDTGRSGKTGRCFKSERGRKRALSLIAARVKASRLQGVARRAARSGVQRFRARRAARLAAMPAAVPAAAAAQRRSMRKKR